MFENADGRTDAGVTGILIAHLGAFSSGELKKRTQHSISSESQTSKCLTHNQLIHCAPLSSKYGQVKAASRVNTDTFLSLLF